MAAVMIALQHKQAEGMHVLRGSEERERRILEQDEQDATQEGFTMQEPKYSGRLEKLVLSASVKEDGSQFSWVPRSVLLDERVIAFTNVRDQQIIDYIPLDEICGVHRLQDLERLQSGGSRATHPMRSVGGGGGGGGQFPFRRKSATGKSDLEAKSGVEATPWTRAFATEISQEQAQRAFEILTVDSGHNSGRSYRLRAGTQHECDQWIEWIRAEVREALSKFEEVHEGDSVTRLRTRLAKAYKSDAAQMLISGLIITNFAISVTSTELLPAEGSDLDNIFEALEDSFTIIFLVELLLVLFINWFKPFWKDLWNIFDLLVISGSLLTMFLEGPGLAILRLVRVFRVLRVIKRLYALRRIINALTKSMIPMVNAFTVLFLVASIYSTLAVILYRDKSPVLFGSFSAAFFTMFQVCTMDDWGETARSLSDDRTVDLSTGVFFVSFVILVGIVILNVVVAVLLDEFVESVTEDREAHLHEILSKRQERQKSFGGPLDPLLDGLAHYNTSLDLSARITTLFNTLDIDQYGTLSYGDLKDGLRKLKTDPLIHLSEEDFNIMTYDKTWCDRRGRLGRAQFERMVRDQLKLYVQRQMARSMVAARCSGSQVADILFVLKQLMVSVDDLGAAAALPAAILSPLTADPAPTARDPAHTFHNSDRGMHFNGSPPPRAESDGVTATDRDSVGGKSSVQGAAPAGVKGTDPNYVAGRLDEVVALLTRQGETLAALSHHILAPPDPAPPAPPSALPRSLPANEQKGPVRVLAEPETAGAERGAVDGTLAAKEVETTLHAPELNATERQQGEARAGAGAVLEDEAEPQRDDGPDKDGAGTALEGRTIDGRGVGDSATLGVETGREEGRGTRAKPDPSRWSWTHAGGRDAHTGASAEVSPQIEASDTPVGLLRGGGISLGGCSPPPHLTGHRRVGLDAALRPRRRSSPTPQPPPLPQRERERSPPAVEARAREGRQLVAKVAPGLDAPSGGAGASRPPPSSELSPPRSRGTSVRSAWNGAQPGVQPPPEPPEPKRWLDDRDGHGAGRERSTVTASGAPARGQRSLNGMEARAMPGFQVGNDPGKRAPSTELTRRRANFDLNGSAEHWQPEGGLGAKQHLGDSDALAEGWRPARGPPTGKGNLKEAAVPVRSGDGRQRRGGASKRVGPSDPGLAGPGDRDPDKRERQPEAGAEWDTERARGSSLAWGETAGVGWDGSEHSELE